ncbi:unnamed protein product [Calypogeia fissa]
MPRSIVQSNNVKVRQVPCIRRGNPRCTEEMNGPDTVSRNRVLFEGGDNTARGNSRKKRSFYSTYRTWDNTIVLVLLESAQKPPRGVTMRGGPVWLSGPRWDPIVR